MMQHSPSQNINPKRRLEATFEDESGNSENNSSLTKSVNSSKRFNISNQQDTSLNRSASINKFDVHMFESEVKANIFKIAKLEQDLISKETEKAKVELEFKSYQEKQSLEIRNLLEAKQQLESALKNSKTNESLLNSEMDHLRKLVDSYEGVKLVDMDKELKRLKSQIADLNEENKTVKTDLEKEVSDLKYELEAKQIEIAKLESNMEGLNQNLEAFNNLKKNFEEIRMENCALNNKIKDLELEKSNLKDNTQRLNDYMDKSNRIDELERENRKLVDEINFHKANQEKSHLFQEELRSKSKQLERFEAKILNLEIENSSLKENIIHLKQEIEQNKTSDTIVKLKNVISDLDNDALKLKDKIKSLDDDIKYLKIDKSDRDEEIIQLQKQLSRLTAERNGYKKIIDIYDSEKGNADALSKTLYKRIDELELIISEYKKSVNDSNELKLCNNTSFQLQEDKNRSVETQVNLNSEIYSNYENKIASLNRELEEMRQQVANLEKSKSQPSETGKTSSSNETIEFLNDTEEDSFNNVSNESSVVKKLEFELKEQKTMNQRIISEFEKKVLDITRSLRHLIGFKILFKDKQIILINLKNREQKLIFQINKDYSVSLIETDYAKEYDQFVEIYMKSYNSIPLFLNAVNFDQEAKKLFVSTK